MKLYNKILFGAAALTAMGALSSCSEDATLGGADAIYIELSATDIEMCVGDTTRLSARVSNVSGDDIPATITWSVDDESVVKLIEAADTSWVNNPNYVKPSAPETETPASEAGEGEADAPAVNTTDKKIPQVAKYWAIVAQSGAQGKSTKVRATLENGQFAVTSVNVGRHSLSNSLVAVDIDKCTYFDKPGDSIRFKVNNLRLVEDFEYSFTFNKIEEYNAATDPQYQEFKINRTAAYTDTLNNSYIVAYITAPRESAKYECVLTLGNEEESIECVNPFYVYPRVSPGFEVDGVRPKSQESNPSNIKVCLMNVTMDVNSTHNVGVCLGVLGGGSWEQDINNAIKAEEGGLFNWSIEGSAVVVESMSHDLNYEGGYVSYMNVRSGAREGLSVITYTMPDTILVCNLTVTDYKKSFPVERIVVKNNDGDETEVDELNMSMGVPASLSISVVPDASFEYHIPEVVAEDPSIVRVIERDDQDGYTRRFEALKPGTTNLVITSLDKTRTVKVTVVDKVQRIVWNAAASANQVMVGSPSEIVADVFMASGIQTSDIALEFSVSDPTVATVERKTGSNTTAILTALKEGTVEVYATAGGVTSQAWTVSITSSSDLEITDAFDGSGVYDNGDGTMGVLFSNSADGIDVIINVPYSGSYFGSFAGSDATIIYGGEYPNSAYDFTIVDNGDGTCSITGTFTLPNGSKIIANGASMAVW